MLNMTWMVSTYLTPTPLNHAPVEVQSRLLFLSFSHSLIYSLFPHFVIVVTRKIIKRLMPECLGQRDGVGLLWCALCCYWLLSHSELTNHSSSSLKSFWQRFQHGSLFQLYLTALVLTKNFLAVSVFLQQLDCTTKSQRWSWYSESAVCNFPCKHIVPFTSLNKLTATFRG